MIIYGNELAASFKEKMKAEIEILKKENKRLPLLTVILVGKQDDRAARRYFTAGIRECRAAAK